MLTINDFINKIILDLNKYFSEVSLDGNYMLVKSGPASMSIPISSMYREYQEVMDYGKTLKIYVDIIYNILNQYKFKIDYNNVYPLLKNRGFGRGEKDLGFYREQAFADIDIYYASDVGEVFRFILNSDYVDFDKMKKAAWENLNKLSNILVRLDDALNLFCLRYTTDYNASFLLSDSMQKQITKKVGRDYLFAIPSSTTLIIAKFCPEYISILKSLMAIDTDPNRISDKVYQYKGGKFDIAAD